MNDHYGQPLLDPAQPRVKVEVTADTYAELAPKAIVLAEKVLGPGRYAAAIVQPGPRIRHKETVAGEPIASWVECDFEVGTPA